MINDGHEKSAPLIDENNGGVADRPAAGLSDTDLAQVDASLTADDAAPTISFAEALVVWMRVALLSFGGPAGQIAVMHRIVVEEKRWIDEARFMHALNYCMILPGPEAQQLATYLGWLLHRAWGGLAAGLLFILPGFIAILGLSLLYTLASGVATVEALFYGLKPGVLALVIAALVRISTKTLTHPARIVLALAAWLAIFVINVPFPIIILAAALLGLAAGARWPQAFGMARHGGDLRPLPPPVRGSWRRAVGLLALWLPLWVLPIVVIGWLLGRDHVLFAEGVFFAKASLVTFGGAYAVLSYIGQQAVEVYGWLAPAQMVDGLGMAESTPGPLIQVVQFVGYMGAYQAAAPFSPVTAGILASVLVTWVTFVPCFLWIFLGAPHVEALRGQRQIDRALGGVTAAVVGVIANLMLFFALHTCFESVDRVVYGPINVELPVWATLDIVAIAIAAVGSVALIRFRWGVLPVLGASILIGGLAYLLR